MSRTLFGLETEYAFTPFAHNGSALDRIDYSRRLVGQVRERYPALSGRDEDDCFLGNGSRLYVDWGCNLINVEYSTPECTAPEELLAHIRAGDRILAELARTLERSSPELKEAFISKTNVDYAGHTSGSHENYLTSFKPMRHAKNLLPHLVSRIIYTGGGGFDDSKQHLAFMLSPRVRFLEHAISPGAQSNRGIFTLKRESLVDSEHYRMHLLCGEGLRCDRSEYLRFGVTSLLARLVDLGERPASGIFLEPMTAINSVARDTSLTQAIGRTKQGPVTALDIQRHYLRFAEQYIGAADIPAWAEDLCRCWRATLDALAENPLALAGVLDWPTKLVLFRQFAENRGRNWHELTDATKIAPTEVRAAAYELDIRFGDIAEDSIFAELRAAAGSQHQLVTERTIDASRRIPPPKTRAHCRGQWVQRLSQDQATQRKSRCNWDLVVNKALQVHVNLQNPFQCELPGG